jgi:hypothetical protein
MKNGMEARIRQLACAGTVALIGMSALAASPNANQAVRMYNRIAGVPPSPATLAQMITLDPVSAAYLATSDKAFYNGTIRNLAAPWTNRDQSVFVPLNDYTATVVGMVRDNVPFNTLLSADLVYIASASASSTYNVPAYSPNNNNMYIAMDQANVDLSSTANLVSSPQSALTGIPSAATAGVMTTRGAASAFFVNGTNRAMFRFTMMNHLCDDLPTVMDTTRPPDRIRQDVTRSPGGVSTLFLTNCIGCHSGMDPMAQAFAYYNFSYPSSEIGATAWPVGQIVYTAGAGATEILHQQHQFPAGLRHDGRHLEQPLAYRTEPSAGMEPGSYGDRPRRQVPWDGTGEQSGVRELPGNARVQGRLPARAEQRQRRHPGHDDDRLVPEWL